MDSLDQQIIDLVVNQGKPTKRIARELGKSQAYVTKVVNEYKYSPKFTTPTKENHQFIAVCKTTGKKFNDYTNSSGALLNHLSDINIELPKELDTAYKRRSYFYNKKGTEYWYELYFDIIEEPILETKNCHYCDWSTPDTDNKSGSYKKHLIDNHNITIEKHLQNYPDDIEYFNVEKRQKEQEKLFKNTDNFVECKICGKKFKQLNRHLSDKHNITSYEYKTKYGFDSKIISKTTNKKNKDNLKIGRETIIEKGIKYQSNLEKEISDFLTKYIPDLKIPDRKLLNGIEIDMISHQHKIGIEFNGLRYHSEVFGKKYRNFHKDKTDLMNEKGYQLIHIFEDEYRKNKKLVLNKLLYIFNIKIDKPRIYARNCSVKQINNNKTINNFLDNNHIQGKCKYDLVYGAYYENNLIAVMCFDSVRLNTSKNTSKETELIRFCTDNNYYVVGIFSKIFKQFLKDNKTKYDQVVSFADIRWTNTINNDIYKLLNFNIVKILKPDYYYLYKHYKKLTKYSFGKSRLKKLFPNIYSDDKTEWEIMQEANYDRIWDCGKIKYIFKTTTEFKINKKGDD